MNEVAILGLGLVGGSLAHACRARSLRVIGIDRANVLALPEARAAADVLVDVADDSAVRNALGAADLVVLAAPVSAIVSELPRALEAAALVTDCGSTKREIVYAAGSAAHFVGGHPLAGGTDAGVVHARADLFEGCRWILCPETATPEAVRTVEEFVRSLGAEVVFLSAKAHDQSVALTSHVVQLVGSALVLAAEKRGAEIAAGPGFVGATQGAGGNPDVWRDILATNADSGCRGPGGPRRRFDRAFPSARGGGARARRGVDCARAQNSAGLTRWRRLASGSILSDIGPGNVRRHWWILFAAVFIAAACDLNPQPEVPSGAAGDSNGSGGTLGLGGSGGSGGITSGNAGANGLVDAAGVPPDGAADDSSMFEDGDGAADASSDAEEDADTTDAELDADVE